MFLEYVTRLVLPLLFINNIFILHIAKVLDDHKSFLQRAAITLNYTFKKFVL